MWCLALGLVLLSDAVRATVPAGFDCSMRRLAIDFAREIQPGITTKQLQDLADALNGAPEAQCRNVSIPPEARASSLRPAVSGLTSAERAVFVSPSGSDDSAGSYAEPMRTIRAALAKVRASGGSKDAVFLRAGTYREGAPIQLTAEDSGLSIAAFAGEAAEISGAIELEPDWKPFRAQTSLSKAPANIWVTDVPASLGSITGLRVGGRRAVRARYPNADPETTLNPHGWVSQKTEWLPPRVTRLTNPPVEYVVDAPEWTRQDSTGNELRYQAGINGSCAHFDPPYGYWCSAHPARDVSGGLTHRWPSGLKYEGLLPNAPYKDPAGAIVHSCRGGADCWFTWMFQVDEQSLANKTLSWTVGGFQGAEGSDEGGSWYIENVLEELDMPNEFFHDAKSNKLYYFHNSSAGTPPPASLKFEATSLKVLLNVTGTQPKPATDITIAGITFRDAAYTFMDPHGMPSGGDWALQRSGALLFAGTERMVVDRCVVTRADGNGISINGYNRNLTIQNSELAWIGDSAIAAWGYTRQGQGGGSITLPSGVGIDGTGGEQPRGTRVTGNVIHELGLYQKQSSMFFQAQSCQTTIERNIFYNGPRAHINFNDQFGGANRITRNLILNACRETADHGPFNSWGRQPYITEVRDGITPSITPATTEIDHNFVLGSYNTGQAIDNDDASEYFETHHNFFVYGAQGLKSDFGGHDNVHHNNVYAYTRSDCLGVGSFKPGHEDGFFNNTCVQQRAGSYAAFDCKSPSLPVMHDNRVFTPAGAKSEVCGKSFDEWQAEGHDARTTFSTWPGDGELIGWAVATLEMRPAHQAGTIVI